MDLWGVIEDLVSEGTTLLLTTQYLEEADRLADRISVVDHGKVIAEGTSAELKAQLGGALVEVRLADADEARRLVGLLSGAGAGEATAEDDLIRVPAGDGTATLTEVVRRLDAEGVRARGLQLREPSLDDVFLALTGHVAEHDGAAVPDRPEDAGSRRDDAAAVTR
jgi:ABC-2 type transport system ATP-binding protein